MFCLLFPLFFSKYVHEFSFCVNATTLVLVPKGVNNAFISLVQLLLLLRQYSIEPIVYVQNKKEIR